MTTPVKKAVPPRKLPPKKTVPGPDPGHDDITKWDEDTAGGTIIPDEVEGTKVVEQPPRVNPSLAERARSLVEKTKKAGTPPRRGRGPRVPVDSLISGAWGLLARMAAPINIPVSRVLAVQAPIAGMVLEDVVKDTVVDKLLQPIATVGQGGEVVFALVGPPLIVGALTKKPEMAPVLEPLLRAALKSWLTIAGPKMEKVMKEEAEFESKYGTTLDVLIESFFADVPMNTVKGSD